MSDQPIDHRRFRILNIIDTTAGSVPARSSIFRSPALGWRAISKNSARSPRRHYFLGTRHTTGPPPRRPLYESTASALSTESVLLATLRLSGLSTRWLVSRERPRRRCGSLRWRRRAQ
jgi:hypothetical protein